MDLLAVRPAESAVDLEIGVGTTGEEDGDIDLVFRAKQPKTLLDKVRSTFPDQSRNGESGVRWSNVSNLSGDSFPMEGSVIMNKKSAGEKRNKKCKNALKPPRPPTSPSLNASDQKLIREIQRLALLKRVRVERVKALNMMKGAKASSSSSNFLAMVFTILFCLIIFFRV